MRIAALRFAADELEQVGRRVMCENDHADAVAALRGMVAAIEREALLERLDDARGIPPSSVESASEEGMGWQAERRAGPPAEIAICFVGFPGYEVVEQLKAMALSWDPARKEWHGPALPGKWERLVEWARGVRVVLSFRSGSLAGRRYNMSRFDDYGSGADYRDDYGNSGDIPY